MFTTFLDKASGLVDVRFLIAYWFPTFFAALLSLALRVWRFGLKASWDWWQQFASLKGVQTGESAQLYLMAGALAAITLVAYLLQVFTRPIIQFYEGYWPLPIRRRAIWRAARIWDNLKAARQKTLEAEDLQAYALLQDCLHHEFPPQKEQIMPTRLGNIIRSAEMYSSSTYGMDAAFWWPRLYTILSPAEKEDTENALAPMTALVNLAALVTIVTLEGVILLWRTGIVWWQVVILACSGILIARLGYLGAVAQATNFGQAIRTAVDLHRFDLLQAMHLELPATPAGERDLWTQLAEWLYNRDRGAVETLRYAHGGGKPPPTEARSTFWERVTAALRGRSSESSK